MNITTKPSWFQILDAYLDADTDNAARLLTDDADTSRDNISAYSENALNLLLTDDQASRIASVGRQWAHEVKEGNGEWSRMRDDAKRALELRMDQLDGNAAEFAASCYDNNSIQELVDALQEDASSTDAPFWGITPSEWFEAVAATLNQRLEDQG